MDLQELEIARQVCIRELEKVPSSLAEFSVEKLFWKNKKEEIEIFMKNIVRKL